MTDIDLANASPIASQSMKTGYPLFAKGIPIPKHKHLELRQSESFRRPRGDQKPKANAPIEPMGLANEIIDYSLSVGWKLTSIKAIGHAKSTAVLSKPDVDVRFRVVVDTTYLDSMLSV